MGVDAAAGAGQRRTTAWSSVILRHLDVPLIVVGAVIAIALGAPVLGCALGAGGWVLQRLIALVDTRWTAAGREPTQQVGVAFVERFGRIWLLAGAIIAAGVAGGRPDGLAAAIAIFVAYSIAFAITIAGGPPPARADQARRSA